MNQTKRLARKDARTMDEVIREYIRNMKISAGLNEQLIYDAWDAVSGAAEYTVSRYLRNGVLYCSLSSSVIRSRLFPKREEIVRKINEYLLEDGLFVRDDPRTGLLKNLILQ